MDVELFLHGVCKGAKFYGDESDRAFFNNFYDGNEDELKLLIQARTVQGKTYIYYSYLATRNIKDCDGRAGSYFGLTVRFDSYCKDFNNIHNILSTLFNSYIVGKVLAKEANGYKYLVSDFTASKQEIDTLKNTFSQLLISTLNNNSFLQTSSLGGNSYTAINLVEATEEVVFNAVKQGKCALSLYFPTKKEAKIKAECEIEVNRIKAGYQAEQQKSRQEYERKLEQLKVELDRQASAKQQEIDEIKRKCETATAEVKQRLSAELEQKRREVSELRKSRDEIQKQYDQIKKKDIENARAENISDAISRIETILNDLLCKVPGLSNKNGKVKIDNDELREMRKTLEELGSKIANKSQKGIKQLWAKIATAISGLCLVLLIAGFAMWMWGDRNTDNNVKESTVIVDSLNNVIEGLKKENNRLKQNNEKKESMTPQVSEEDKKPYSSQNAKIDLVPYKN